MSRAGWGVGGLLLWLLLTGCLALGVTPTVEPGPPRPVPASTSAGVWWQPTPAQPIHWHWQLSGDYSALRNGLPGVTVYDIDGEQATAELVAALHALGPRVIVICYFDAGVFESYRSDAAAFPQRVIGKADEGWDDAYWLDIRQVDVLLPIMRERMQRWCKDKGFDAVEPDETEVWGNDTGFPLTRADNTQYAMRIALLAHEMGLSVGLKSNTASAAELWPYFDWSLNEQCWEYNECELLRDSFLAHGKAVFNIEYNVDPNCALANAWHMNAARRDLHLVSPQDADYRYQPCVADDVDVWE